MKTRHCMQRVKTEVKYKRNDSRVISILNYHANYLRPQSLNLKNVLYTNQMSLNVFLKYLSIKT